MLEFLNALRGQVPAEQWDREPEVHQVGRLYHYILPFVEGSDTSVFNFTITVDDTAWFFTHLENIVIRLDRISELPATSFPDIAQEQKAWMREEIYWSFIVHLYRTLSRDKGSSFVLDLLRDGSGFALAAKTWVPFVPQKRAFVLYLCWEQANLRGNTVSLDTLTDTLAIVTLTPTYLLLHKRTAHLKNQISLQDYRRIFETIWQDRARAAGWNLTIAFPNDEQCIFTLR